MLLFWGTGQNKKVCVCVCDLGKGKLVYFPCPYCDMGIDDFHFDMIWVCKPTQLHDPTSSEITKLLKTHTHIVNVKTHINYHPI